MRAAAARRAGALLVLVATVAGVVGVTTPASAAWAPGTQIISGLSGNAGVDVDPVSGAIWVAETNGSVLRKYDASGHFLLQVGGFGTQPGQINGPFGLAVAPNGDVLVTDVGNLRIQRWAADGTYLGAIAVPGMQNANGIDVDPAGNIYVTDVFAHTVLKFTAAGVLDRSYPALGPSSYGIGVDPAGKIWVTTTTGEIRRADAATGVVEWTTSVPTQWTDVDFDAAGNANVLDFNNGRVWTYRPDGTLLGTLDTGMFAVRLAIGPDGRLLVGGGGQVRAFAPVLDDTDGIDPAVENGAPNGGDGNGDGVQDSIQANVASLPSTTSVGYVTVAAPSGTTVAAVASLPLPVSPVPPAGFTFPAGLLGFEVRGVAVGGTATVEVVLPPGMTPDAVLKLVGGAYVTLPGATVSANRITMVLQDGDAFDADGVANGVIVDPLAPGEATAVATTTTVATSGSPSTAGAVVTFTATVAALTGPTVPTGSVVFTVDGVPGAPVAVVAGTAATTVAAPAVGSHTVMAAFTPDTGGFLASDSTASPLTQVVVAGPLAALTITPANLVAGAGQNQTFTVAGRDAVGTPLGDLTAQATFTIAPNGTCTLNVCRSGTIGTKTVTARIGTVAVAATMVVRTAQTIAFNPGTAAKTMAQSPLTLVASASSGLAVTLSSRTPLVCTTSGLVATFLTTGTCTIAADQAGNATIAPAPTVVRSFPVVKATQTITFTNPGARPYSPTPIPLTASTTSGLPITFTTSTPAVCVATGANGAQLQLVAAGSCTVTANQAGNAVYNSATLLRTFNVTKLAQTITFATPGPKNVAQSPVSLSATASSGLAVTFTTTTPGVCTTAGPNGSQLVLLIAGTCTIRAAQAGDGIYNAAGVVTRSIAIARGAQTITAPAVAPTPVAASPVLVAATASSGLPVTLTSTTPAVCTASGPASVAVVLVAAGTCTLQATQAGNAGWTAAPAVSTSFTVLAQQSQTITFAPISTQPMNRIAVTTNATASSGLVVSITTTTPAVCSVSGSTVSLVGAGTCTLDANQAGDAAWLAAPTVTQSFAVVQVPQAIIFPAPSQWRRIDGAFSLFANATSGLPVSVVSTTPAVCTYTGNTLTPVAGGSCVLEANQAGDATYLPAPAFTVTIDVIELLDQTITFDAIADQSLRTFLFPVSATASSGLPVRIASQTPSVCTTDGTFANVAGPDTVIMRLPGTCTLQAIQAGDSTYQPAPTVTQSFTVLRPPPEIQAFNASPFILGSDGGTVQLGAAYAYAATCEITVDPPMADFPYSQPCEANFGGGVGRLVTLPANTGSSSDVYTFTFTASHPGQPSATATAEVRVAPSSEAVADLTATTSSPFDPAFVGTDLVYTMVIGNDGPNAANDVVATATWPLNARFSSITTTQGSCTNTAVDFTCALGSIPTGSTVTIALHTDLVSDGAGELRGTVATSSTEMYPGEFLYRYLQFTRAPMVYTDDQTGQVLTMSEFGGQPTALTTQPGSKSDAVPSPDRHKVAYSRQNPTTFDQELWVVNLDGSDEHFLLSLGGSSVRRPSWAPDGATLVVTAPFGGQQKAVVVHASGAPDPQPLIADLTYGEIAPAFSPDGAFVIAQDSCLRPAPDQCRYLKVAGDGSGSPTVYDTYPIGRTGVVVDPAGEWFYYATVSGDIVRGRVDGTASEVVVAGTYGGSYWSLSPRGDKIAYTSLGSNTPTIAVIDVDGTNGQQLTTPYNAAAPAGCYSPTWNTNQTRVLMHCYPGSGAIGIYQGFLPSPGTFPASFLGGSFRSRNVQFFGGRPTF